MRRILLCTAMTAVFAPATLAQVDTAEARPFVEGGVFDKPYLVRLAGRAAFGGYVDVHGRHEREDGVGESAFDLKRLNLFTAAQVSDFVRFAAEIEFEEAGEEVKIEFAAIDLGIHQALSLRGGMLLVPLGRFNLSHDSPFNEFTDRPVVSTDILGVALSEPGLGAFGLFGLGGLSRITYELYAVNGFGDGVITDAPGGTSIPAGRQPFENANGSPSVVGRTTYSPAIGWEVGVSGHYGAYNVFDSDGLQIDERRNLAIWALDFQARPLGFRLEGEGAIATLDVSPSLTGIYASRQAGLYVDLLRDFGRGWISVMQRSYFSVGVRLDLADFDRDLDGDSVRQLTLGLNFRPTEDTVFKLNYFRGTRYDRFNNPAAQAGLLLSAASYF